jgi:hypothetical protein
MQTKMRSQMFVALGKLRTKWKISYYSTFLLFVLFSIFSHANSFLPFSLSKLRRLSVIGPLQFLFCFALYFLGKVFFNYTFYLFGFFVCLANGIGKSICTLFACKNLVLNKYFSYKEQENYLKLIIVSGGKI